MGRIQSDYKEIIEYLNRDEDMIKHMPGFTAKELRKKNPDVPIWERREAWFSPLVVILLVGYAVYYIGVAILWVLKWTIFSWIVPFVEWKYFCEIGLHKYRRINTYSRDNHQCKVCKKIITVQND